MLGAHSAWLGGLPTCRSDEPEIRDIRDFADAATGFLISTALDIPWEIEGTAWVTVESLGRLATSVGPAAGKWQLQR